MLPRHERGPVQVIPTLELPDSLTRIAGVVRGRNRPEGVRRLHHVRRGLSSAPGRPGDDADEQRDGEQENEQSREHVFVGYRTPVRLVKIALRPTPFRPSADDLGQRGPEGESARRSPDFPGRSPLLPAFVYRRGGFSTRPSTSSLEGHEL